MSDELNYIVDSLDGVDEGIKKYYKEDKDAGGYVLKMPGVVTDSRFNELKEQYNKLKTDSNVNEDKYKKELDELMKKYESKPAPKKGEEDAKLREEFEEMKRKWAERDEADKAREIQNRQTTKSDKLREKLSGVENLNQSYINDLLQLIQSDFEVDDTGAVLCKKEHPVTGKPMSWDAYEKEIIRKKTIYFSNTPTGSGAAGGLGVPPRQPSNAQTMANEASALSTKELLERNNKRILGLA